MLTDFGIAKALDDTSSVTGMGPIGTPAYMAPEVCAWDRATPASDQYSLACVAFEMLSGRRPFDADGIDVREAHMNEPPATLAKCAPGTSRVVCDAIERALEKDPARRFRDARTRGDRHCSERVVRPCTSDHSRRPTLSRYQPSGPHIAGPIRPERRYDRRDRRSRPDRGRAAAPASG